MKSFIIYLISLLVGIETKYLLIKLRDPNALRHGVVGQPMQGQMVPKGPAGVMPRIPAQGGGGLGLSVMPRIPAQVGGGLGQIAGVVPRRPAAMIGHVLPQMMPILSPSMGAVPIVPILMGGWGSSSSSSSSSSR